MIWLGQAWLEFSESYPLASTVLQWILHASVIVLFAVAFDRFAGDQRATARRRVWTCAMTALLVLAVLTPTAFPLGVAFHVPNDDLLRPNAAQPQTAVVPAPAPGMPLGELTASNAPLELMPMTRPSATKPPPHTQLTDREVSSFTTPQLLDGLDWRTFTLVVYSLGVIISLVLTIISAARLHLLWTRAEPLTEESSKLARSCASRLGLRQEHSIRVSSRVKTAMTWGALRPVVLLPADFVSWRASEQRHCLLHELAHVAQRDGLWNWMGQLVCSVYWFHPLAHFAKARLRRVCEEAADDRVVESGESATDYSRSLLAITIQVSSPDRVCAGAMGAATGIEQRIQRVLADRARRPELPRWIVLTSLACLMLISCTTLRTQAVVAEVPVTQRSGEPASDDPVSRPADDPAAEENAPTPTTDEPLAETLVERFRKVAVRPRPEAPADLNVPDITIRGTVTDANGPITGAVVLARETRPVADGPGQPPQHRVVGRATTDQRGIYEVNGLRAPNPNLTYIPSWELVAADGGHRFGVNVTPIQGFIDRRPDVDELRADIVMPDTDTIVGRVVSTDGEPLANAQVLVQLSTRIGISARRDPFARRDPSDPFSAPRHTISFGDDAIRPMVVTDDRGRFGWKMPAGEVAQLLVRSPGYYPRTLKVTTSDPSGTNRPASNSAVRVSPVDVELRELVEISVTVVNEKAEPIAVPIEIRFRGPTRYTKVAIKDKQTWKTTAEFLRESAPSGQLKLHIKFKPESGVLDLEQVVSVDQLLASRSLELKTTSGTRVSGLVVSTEGPAIPRVSVVWHSRGNQIESQLYTGATDSNGSWDFVAPRKAGFVSVLGQSTGHDLPSSERFNAEGGLDGRWTKAFDPTASNDATVFQIEPIANRRVRVINTQGAPVANASVEAKYILTITEDEKVYRLHQSLAKEVETDKEGECELTLALSKWNEGTIYASLVEFDEETGQLLTQLHGRCEIEPDSSTPLTVTLKEFWKVTGRVAVDGRPARDYRVHLTKRLDGRRSFGVISGYDTKVDARGSYEVSGPADYEYSIAVESPFQNNTYEYYFSQEPIKEVSPGRFRFPDLILRSDQFKSRQECYEEMAQREPLQ